jgi:hypothetical protein
MLNSIRLRALCFAFGVIPTFAVAHPTLSGSYTISEIYTCPVSPTQYTVMRSGTMTFAPATGTTEYLVGYDMLIVPGVRPHLQGMPQAGGTFQVKKDGLMVWDGQKVHVTFGSVQDRIAQSAIVVGESNTHCAFQASLTRTGP